VRIPGAIREFTTIGRRATDIAFLQRTGALRARRFRLHGLEHDPEKWIPVFRKDHAPPKIKSAMTIQPKAIAL
jgi:hypothetical protein